MKVLGIRIRDMAKLSKDMQIAIVTTANSKMVNQTAQEFTHGQMEKFMTGNGVRGSNRATESGEDYKMIRILANGKTLKRMATVSTPGKMGISMRVPGKMP